MDQSMYRKLIQVIVLEISFNLGIKAFKDIPPRLINDMDIFAFYYKNHTLVVHPKINIL